MRSSRYLSVMKANHLVHLITEFDFKNSKRTVKLMRNWSDGGFEALLYVIDIAQNSEYVEFNRMETFYKGKEYLWLVNTN